MIINLIYEILILFDRERFSTSGALEKVKTMTFLFGVLFIMYYFCSCTNADDDREVKQRYRERYCCIKVKWILKHFSTKRELVLYIMPIIETVVRNFKQPPLPLAPRLLLYKRIFIQSGIYVNVRNK